MAFEKILELDVGEDFAKLRLHLGHPGSIIILTMGEDVVKRSYDYDNDLTGAYQRFAELSQAMGQLYLEVEEIEFQRHRLKVEKEFKIKDTINELFDEADKEEQDG